MAVQQTMVLVAVLGAVCGCQKADPPQVTATLVDTRFVAREAFLAAGEMQISGEPFAQTMGRQLTDYSRDHLPTDIYFDPSPQSSGPHVDLPGFSSAVESYEYSKQPMNNVAFESGAGTSLLHGTVLNPNGLTGAAAATNMAQVVQHFATGSNALGRFVFAPDTYPTGNASGNVNPSGVGDATQNPLGWPGIWPTAHIFRSFDPTISPTSAADLQCAISSDDDPGATGALGCADYECDATSLHLRKRTTQVDATITPGTDGFAGWKYGLWTLNYLQSMHDGTETAVVSVPAGDANQVGSPNNAVVGADADGNPTGQGTYLGSSDIEGFQAQMFISAVNTNAADWLDQLSTSDGVQLGGFASLQDALQYNYTAPLRWFPGAITVSETADGSGFPVPHYGLAVANSEALDLLGLALAYSEFYALTDRANTQVGGAQPAEAYFDGDPFPQDDGLADGEPTLHDRALAMLRVALVNLDRLHTDPTSGIVVDDVTFTGNQPTRGTTVSTTTVAYTMLSLRTALRSMTSALQLYSNNTPDSGDPVTPLDALPLAYPGNPQLTFGARLKRMLQSHAQLLLQNLTQADGHAFAGWNVATGAPTDGSDTLDAHTAAVRGLFAAYLATGETAYRDRAVAVFTRLEAVFYDSKARVYTATPAPCPTVEFTPLRFALLQSAHRDMYELVGTRPGQEALASDLEDRVARLNKLVLNGWDDRNQNQVVDWPDECVRVVSGLPRGGLQMAERTLTGETGSLQEQLAPGQPRTPTSDREHDCVPEIDDAQLPAALANSVTFTIEDR